jgi:hypothetical protein
MAEMNATATSEIEHNENTVTMTIERWHLALESSYEIEKLAETLRETAPLDDANFYYVVRGITARLKELASIVMRIDDNVEKTKELAYCLRLDIHPNAN